MTQRERTRARESERQREKNSIKGRRKISFEIKVRNERMSQLNKET